MSSYRSRREREALQSGVPAWMKRWRHHLPERLRHAVAEAPALYEDELPAVPLSHQSATKPSTAPSLLSGHPNHSDAHRVDVKTSGFPITEITSGSSKSRISVKLQRIEMPKGSTKGSRISVKLRRTQDDDDDPGRCGVGGAAHADTEIAVLRSRVEALEKAARSANEARLEARRSQDAAESACRYAEIRISELEAKLQAIAEAGLQSTAPSQMAQRATLGAPSTPSSTSAAAEAAAATRLQATHRGHAVRKTVASMRVNN